jgi:hypothetical protein
MKWTITVLIFVGASGLVGGITNIQHLHMGRETTIVYGSTGDRIFALAVGILSLVAAYACKKKKGFGWWLVTGMIGALMLATLWGIVRVFASDVFLALSWLAQTAVMAALLYWWTKQKKHFGPHEERGPTSHYS